MTAHLARATGRVSPMHNACGILWRSRCNCILSYLTVCYPPLRILAACRVNLRDSESGRGMGPIVRYEFRVAGPQRLLIEPQILAISKGIWKGLSTEGEMKCTRGKQTIVAFPSRYSRLSMNRNGHERAPLRNFTRYVIFRF